MKRAMLSITVAALLAGCANSSHIITGKTRPATDPAQVRVYTTPPAKYEEIAIIEASSRGAFAPTDQMKSDTMIARLKAEAAKLGANGVLLQTTGRMASGAVAVVPNPSASPAVAVSSNTIQKEGQGRAIYVTQD